MNTALSAHSWDTQNRVQQALDAGYEVTIHESPVTESGWMGAGYAAIDSNTGAGGYIIDGGSNGGAFYWVAGSLSANAIVLGAVSAAVSAVVAGGFLVYLGIALGVLVAFLGVLNLISALYYGNDYQKGCFYGAFFLSVGMVLGGLGLPVTSSNLVAVFGAMFPGGDVIQCFLEKG